MKKLFDLMGLPVMSATDGEPVGIVIDCLIKKETLPKVEGFVIEKKDGTGSILVPWYDIRFGEEAAIATLRKVPEAFDKKALRSDLLLRENLMDLRVFTNDGKELGLLKDIVLSETEGVLEGIQCSDGLIGDLMHGRTIYPVFGRAIIGNEQMYVDKACVEESYRRDEKEELKNE